MYYMGCCEDYLTSDIAFNAVMPLSRASTRGRYSRIEGVTCWYSSFLQEAEFNEVMMVPSSEQLQSGKWACDLTAH